MKHIKQWPEYIDLGLPSPSHKSLIALLIEPFSTAQEAEAFWFEYCCELFIIESQSDLVSEDELVQLCLDSPDFSETIGDCQVSALITNDGGGGALHRHSPASTCQVIPTFPSQDCKSQKTIYLPLYLPITGGHYG